MPHSSRLYRGGWGCGSLPAGPGTVLFDFDAAGFAGCPVVEAAPWPVFRFRDEAAFDWVAMDVAELLNEFVLGEDVEVVVAGLPELGAGAFEEFRGLSLQDT
ncbi:MAG: hypothetical protein M3O31_00595 [Acidobacteriota bacterium]|nr:hypothetical protein [Acidobacteriota bacterium]